MNFTREPIIETVITPREGCKLVIRSSKGTSSEDYFVDAVEVVSFGHSFFFRSQERPKSFLVPLSDYEVIELKETRMVLKNVSSDRSIKIGGGREAPAPRPREEDLQQDEERSAAPQPQDQQQLPQQQQRDRKRDKRRRGRRGRDRDRGEMREQQPSQEVGAVQEEEHNLAPEDLQRPPEQSSGGEEKLPTFISKLFPPPPTLIKESLSRYKPAEEQVEEKPSFDENVFEHPTMPDANLEDDNEE